MVRQEGQHNARRAMFVEIHVAGASKAAVAAVEKAGGSVVLPAGATAES